MPHKVWQVGEEVLAADFNSYLQDQVVVQFPNVAARDTWLSPPDGAHAYTVDTATDWVRVGGAWRQAISIGALGVTAPYVGAAPASPYQTLIRAGHITVTTSGFGDAIVNFTTPFPNGVISVVASPWGTGVWWWPMIVATFLTGFQFFATSVNGHPFASGHPPSQPNVYTQASGPVQIDYFAIGV